MKTKPSTLTEEQRAARLAAEAFFSDLLAKPSPKEKKSKSPTAKPNNNAHTSTDPSKSEYYIATERQYHIVTQECLTCGALHRYALTRLIRFRARNRKDNLHIELPCSLPPALDLPARVIHSFETTDFCPQCLDTVLRVEVILPAEPDSAKQLSLFS